MCWSRTFLSRPQLSGSTNPAGTTAGRVRPLPDHGPPGLRSQPQARVTATAIAGRGTRAAVGCVRHSSGASYAARGPVSAPLHCFPPTVCADIGERWQTPQAQRSAAVIRATSKHAAAPECERPDRGSRTNVATTHSSGQPANHRQRKSVDVASPSGKGPTVVSAADSRRENVASGARRAPTADQRQTQTSQAWAAHRAATHNRGADQASASPSQRQIIDRLLLGGPLRRDEPLLRRASVQRLNFSMQVIDPWHEQDFVDCAPCAHVCSLWRLRPGNNSPTDAAGPCRFWLGRGGRTSLSHCSTGSSSAAGHPSTRSCTS
jgi:hypothetical protein